MNQTVLLTAPEGFTDVSFGGESYHVENGLVEVPAEAAEHLYAFGFGNAPVEPEKEPEKDEKKTGKQPEKKAE